MYVDRGATFYKNVSPLVASRYKTSTQTTAIPHVVMVSPDGNYLLGSVNGSKAKESSSYKAIAEVATSFLESGTIPKQPENLKWYITAEGTSYISPMVGITDRGIIMNSSGKKTRVSAFSELQPGAVKFAKRYAKTLADKKMSEALKEVRKDFVFPKQEIWVSSKGRETKAQFVSLVGETLSLEVLKFGFPKKTHSLPLDKLDETSQAKAKKWQEILTSQTEQEEKIKAELM